jgi:hypothetical protein
MKGTHAVVIGGSMTGLSAGRVLSDYFAHVTVVDRDAYPDGALERPGVPHSRHVHALLARGRKELEALFTGFDQAMRDGGAHELDFASTFATLRPTGWAPRVNNHMPLFFASRTLIESVVRGLFRKLPNTTLLERVAVTGLAATGADFRFPYVEGKRPRVSHLISPYMEMLFRAGDDDAVIRRQVGQVLNMLKLPAALFAPHIMARVAWWALQRKLHGANALEQPISAMPPVLTPIG